MKPFSAAYFLKKNKLRAVLLVFMIVITFSIYLGGLYISNVEGIFEKELEKCKPLTFIMPSWKDNEYEDFNKTVEMLKEEDDIILLGQGIINNIYTTSIMNFNMGVQAYSFRNAKDFETYCEFYGINIKEQLEGKELGNGSLIFSSLQADNRGMKLGDIFSSDNPDEHVDQEYELDALTDEDGYSVYCISDTDNLLYIILQGNMSNEEYKNLQDRLKNENKVRVFDYDSYKNNVDNQLETFSYIYFFVILLMSVVMAITINAAFVGMYQHRQGEFALYRAIGISKMKLKLKIVSEVLIIDVIGIVIGLCVTITGVYLLNHLYLIERGLRLFYFNEMSLAGMIISNMIIFIPIVFLQGRRLIKTDICDY